MERYVEVERVADLLGVSTGTVRKWIITRYIPGGVKIKNRWRLRVSDVNGWLEAKHQQKEIWKWPVCTSDHEAPSGKHELLLTASLDESQRHQLITEKLRRRLMR